jgi:hypothetical protein
MGSGGGGGAPEMGSVGAAIGGALDTLIDN